MSNISASQVILVVEDSDDDYEATEMALRESKLANPLVRCEDGQEALDYLLHQGVFEESKPSLPGIILLDLNMPGIDGRHVLEKIKSTDRLKKVPVVVLTTSNDDRDIEGCYSIGANTYIKKPVDLDSFMNAIQRMKEYWFEIAILPKDEKLSHDHD